MRYMRADGIHKMGAVGAMFAAVLVLGIEELI
jgi:hypothetical protein